MNEVTDDFDLQFYAGYRGREIPRAVIIGGQKYPVREILGIRRNQDLVTGERSEIFKCRLSCTILENCSMVEIEVFEHHHFEIKFIG